MKIQELTADNPLQLLRETIHQVEVSLERLIVADEFNRGDTGYSRYSKDNDYRIRAWKRLIKLLLPFKSEHNIHGTMVKALIDVNCPYCHARMKSGISSGTYNEMSYDYHCECGAHATIRMPTDGIGITPPPQNEE